MPLLLRETGVSVRLLEVASGLSVVKEASYSDRTR
jgi:hypothetical protein